MNIKPPSYKAFRGSLPNTALKLLCTLAAAVSPLVTHAATAVYTNAPANIFWTNGVNWVEGAYPGAVNMTGNTVNGDIAIFTNPIAGSGIGGAANPILVGDATIAGDRSQQVSGLTFDGTNCGAYVISGTTPPVYPGTGIPEVGILNVSHNGAIRMNAPVTNIETVLCPILTRLPSSTQGVFNFINNAVNTNGVFVIYSVTNDSATTRGTTFVLDGSNTGTNTIYSLSQGLGANGSSWITKQGTGTWVLPGANAFTAKAPHLVDAGLLVLQNTAPFGAATTVIVTSNAVVRVDAVSITNTFALNQVGTVRENGISTLSEFTVATASGTAPTLATTSPTDVMTVGTAAGAISSGSSSSVLHTAGPGTVVLSQSDTYIGKWSVDAGTNQISNASALGTGPNLNISAGAVFDTTPLTVSSGTYALTTAAISGNGNGTVVGSTAATINADPSGTIDLSAGKTITATITPTSFTGDLTHPALYVANGTLKLMNNSFAIVNNTGTPLGTGTYTLIQQASGNVTDGGGYSVASVTGGGLVAGDVGSIVVSGGSVNLIVAPYVPKNLVWTGGNLNTSWDINLDANFLNGAVHSVFNNADNVTFNSVGSSNPVVTVVGTLAPSSLVVNATTTNYTFTGNGFIAGLTSLIKMGPSNLLVQTTNTYSGGTIISNGVLQLGSANVIPDGPAGDVTVYGTLDMNGNSDIINGLNGTGIIDTVSGGAPVLSVGNNNDGGTFSGVIQNTAGTLGITCNSTNVQVLSGNNTYAGPTTVNNGTLRVDNFNALGSGLSPVTVNLGVLDLQTSVIADALAGAGTVENNSSATASQLVITNAATFNGLIADGTGGGGVGVLIVSGTTRMNGNNTYSGGTFIAAGAGLSIGGAPAQPGTGGIIASNNTTISQPNTGSSSSTMIPNITTVPGATVTFSSRTTANAYADLFYGAANSTNIFTGGNMSIGGTGSPPMSFSNFLGTVIVTAGELRMFNAVGGGDNTTFIFTNNGGVFTRDPDTVHLGALFGDFLGLITGPTTAPGTYLIGGANIDCNYGGSIRGTNNIVKIGTGTLTLSGGLTNYISSPDAGLTFVTNAVPWNDLLNYQGFTTVSNGTLQLIAPATLTNWPTPITLASSTAVFDARYMGYINTDGSTFTNVVTNGVFEVVSGQTNGGVGTILASNVLLDAGSSLNVGLPTGLLTVTANQGISLAGAVNMNIDPANSTNSELAASSFTVVPGATLTITNVSTNYANTVVYHMFNSAINTNNFAAITLPTVTSPVVISNWLSLNGELVIVAPASVNLNPTNLVFSTSGSGTILNLSWPADHTGWQIQIQTNSLAVGLTNNWVTLLGTELVNSTNLPINPANGTVFYRMYHP
jgi:fibronectin-binding autotransporter adhesin